jgi:glycosyltransferase involved in cell wall biosynthesis
MPFARFLVALGDHVDHLVILGRLDPGPDAGRVPLPADVEFVALPWWEDLSHPAGLARALPGTLARFWRVLEDVDAVLLFGPSPIGALFSLLARARGRKVVLGVRMSYPDYIRRRHPARPSLHRVADALDAQWRLLARRLPTVVVGAGLARRYARARRLLPALVSLVDERDLVSPPGAPVRGDGPRMILSVGRLDAEKNPLLLADVLARLRADDPRDDWRLVVCGDGPMRDALHARLAELGVERHAEVRGFVPHEGLRPLYRAATMLLHVSWTEGVPQVLLEAFAAGLPVVATDVGGVADATGDDAALLVPPGDARAAADALRRLAGDPALSDRMVEAARERVRGHTLQAESARIARFIAGAPA